MQIKDKEIKTIRAAKLVPNNFASEPVLTTGMDLSGHIRENFHLVRKGEGLDVISDGKTDYKKLIASEAKNAGLKNIIRLQEMRYGTIENAIVRNKEKQTFADVSNIPLTVAEQAEYVKSIQADVDELCGKLGISKEDLLKANQQFLADKLAAINKPAEPSSAEGSEE